MAGNYGDKLFNSYILEAVEAVYQAVGRKGYRSKSDFTNNFAFGPFQVQAHNPPYTMCVSFQFQLILTAINIYAAVSGDHTVYGFLKRSEWLGLNGLTLQNCVWENEHCHSVGQALSLFGMGEMLAFPQLAPGSFVSYDRGKGGHSVCFLGYLDDRADLVPQYSPNVAGFRYIASNGSGSSGEGISYRDGVLAGRTMRQGGMKQSKGIKNLRGGAMHSPSIWHAPSKAHFTAELSTAFSGLAPNPPSGQR